MSAWREPAGSVEQAEKTFWEQAAETRWGSYMTAHERKALVRAMSIAGGPGVSVEVGCEGGRWSKLLYEAGWRVVCTDVDAEALALCGRRLPEATCLLVEPEATTIPVGDGSARLVLVSEVAPVSQSEWFPGEAARVLEQGGILVCTFYNPASLRGLAYRGLRGLQRWRKGGTRFHEHYYSGPSYARFRKDLQRAGFRMLDQEGICWFPFSRQSDSPLIPICTQIEARLGLRRLTALSPFVIAIAKKEPTDAV